MQTKKGLLSNSIFYVFVSGIGIAMIYPILWMMASSLKPATEIFNNAISLIPSQLMWENYSAGWAGFGGIGFATYFRNSVIVTSIVVVGTLLTGSIVAYGFARLEFKFKNALFACLMATIMLPVQITLIPQYIIFNEVGWVNTFYPLLLPGLMGGQPFFIFLLIQFIRGIPRELDEAAIVDGCSKMGIYWRIILPLLRPALVTVALFSFMWTWDDFLAPLIYLNNSTLHTVTIALRNFMDTQGSTSWGPLLAMSSLSLLPQLLIFAFFQKHLVQGIATTGLK
ncbi:carbohydrate ABC transporter membrane protein 2, CUT1 family (TC 3.A.1.1.-) [Amphibacillus marinus]|uniref:Carbohydrate ABC transporter membrane protein 2, CUT1 family (TC 3.A.1.1.-) n=1 Tax=Amphibacillus marinus TaxID=872970 RepID=A0A1H8H619_9BACI|nr:carbohydrate ABC transporter permease [Amphibacillus marinus]SEN50918.1 carbohydrate ABC transporter membrane protein 2, CUT1 family (TC 3.A.1.1.-) [Amphibacillus marinus]